MQLPSQQKLKGSIAVGQFEFQILTLVAFALSMAPLVYSELRQNTLSNVANGVLFAVGCAVHLVGLSLGLVEFSWSAILLDVAIAVGLLALFVGRMLHGGSAKLLIALLPWLSFDAYTIVFIAAMISIVAIAKIQRTNSGPVTPGVLVGALGVMLYSTALV